MRRRRTGRRRVLTCPQCGSAKIGMVAGMILGQVYRCQKCDYVGSLVLEVDVPDDPAAPS